MRGTSYGARMLESLGEDVTAGECVGYIAAGTTVTVQLLAGGGGGGGGQTSERQRPQQQQESVLGEVPGAGASLAQAETTTGTTGTGKPQEQKKASPLAWLRCFKRPKPGPDPSALPTSAAGAAAASASFLWEEGSSGGGGPPSVRCSRDGAGQGAAPLTRRPLLLLQLPTLPQLLLSSASPSLVAAGRRLLAHPAAVAVGGFHFHKGSWHPDATIVLRLHLGPTPASGRASQRGGAVAAAAAAAADTATAPPMMSPGPGGDGRGVGTSPGGVGDSSCVMEGTPCAVSAELKVSSASAFACMVLGLNAAMHMRAGGEGHDLVNELPWVVA